MMEKKMQIQLKARNIVSELTKEEGLMVMKLLLERSQVEEISDAIILVKMSYEVRELARKLL